MHLIGSTVLFRIPIYKEKKEDYYSYLNKLQEERVKKLSQKPGLAEYYSKAENQPSVNPKKIQWEYNRIIGWIDLYQYQTSIKAELWKIRLKRIPKNFNCNVFDDVGKLTDVCFLDNQSNEDLKKQVISFLRDLNKGEYGPSWLKKSFIDTSLTINQLQFLDLKNMMLNNLS